MKSTPEQIRQRFDNDVERFSNLETGQTATIDAPLTLELIARCASAVNPDASQVLDVGCGAGNYTLKLLEYLPRVNVTLVDLSQPMLDRAIKRIEAASSGVIETLQGDIREVQLDTARYDIIMAAAVLHHLRDEKDWERVFLKFYRVLKPGGTLWVSDLVEHSDLKIRKVMWQRYADYLISLKDETYQKHVFGYIEQEDTPRPLLFQLDMLRRLGFSHVEVLHKNGCFAAYAAIK